MATYGWRAVDDTGNPVPEQNWATPDRWDLFPLTNPPATGIVPGAADTALLGAGTIDVTSIIGSLSQAYPVTIDVTDSRTVGTLGLGGLAVVGVTGSFQPVFGAPTVFPLVKVTGTLHVGGDVVDNFVGTLSVPVSGWGRRRRRMPSPAAAPSASRPGRRSRWAARWARRSAWTSPARARR